ncbi:hypothetical protein GLYMA_11G049500v4 [Glycine max]|uniref:Secreted protein n=1 Tax=Glycine max TaxID=3847 RepID=A0A0R0HLH0_SOYBN|nr:hypothetical protein JHK85_030730 [Glycine max]KAG4993366.1 hypothetical protein JHK86_030193 [Glycine max]KRH28376.1 hypothetical protein GLYMA_11G049500v4 [Glycine max]
MGFNPETLVSWCFFAFVSCIPTIKSCISRCIPKSSFQNTIGVIRFKCSSFERRKIRANSGVIAFCTPFLASGMANPKCKKNIPKRVQNQFGKYRKQQTKSGLDR